ncbi:DNA polymerase III subunit delta [Desulfovibrionales bacterium]
MTRPGFYFLICSDTTLLKRHIETVLADYPLEAGRTYKRHVFWADEGLSSRFWETLIMQNLFSDTKAVIIRRAQLLRTEDWNALSNPLACFNNNIFPFFVLEVNFEKKYKKYIPKIPASLTKQPYWTFAQKRNWVWFSPGLNAHNISTFLKDWATIRNLSFGPGALDALSRQLPLDAGTIEHELAKIELYLTTDTISVKDAELISFAPEVEIFTFLDTLQHSTSAFTVWKQALCHELDGNIMFFNFLALLAREIRILWQLCFGEDPKGIPSFLLSSKQALAHSLGPATLTRLLTMVLDAEYGVKSGEHSPGQAMEFLTANLSAIFSVHR